MFHRAAVVEPTFSHAISIMKESIPPSMTLPGFADDHSIRKSFPAKYHTSEENTINTIESNLTTIADWMTSMHLELNSDKTEFIMFGSRHMLKHGNTSQLDFGGSPIQQSKLVKYHIIMLCISHLDYSNAFLYGINKKLLQKYQRIQNMCGQLVLNKYKYDSAMECLKPLHWLPVD